MTVTVRPPAAQGPVTRVAAERVAATNTVAMRFFGENADAIARACHAIADRFQQGGRLFVCGDGAQRSDVAHVVVEFVHPVVVGKRALPAIPLPTFDGGAAARALSTLGRTGDVFMMLSADAILAAPREVLVAAHARGLLTIALVGPGRDAASLADHVFAVQSADPCIVQETHEILYHVLWELVHVFFEHRAVSA